MALDQLHREIGTAVAEGTQLVNRHDAGMLQLAGDLGFLDEAANHARACRDVIRAGSLPPGRDRGPNRGPSGRLPCRRERSRRKAVTCAERSAESGISGDEGRITGPGSVIESASRSRTGGMLPNASPNEAKTLDEAGPNVIVTSGNCGTVAQQTRLEQASRTQTRRGIGGSLLSTASAAIPLIHRQISRDGPRSHYDFMTDGAQKVTRIPDPASESFTPVNCRESQSWPKAGHGFLRQWSIGSGQARICLTTLPCTSVSRKSRPWNL